MAVIMGLGLFYILLGLRQGFNQGVYRLQSTKPCTLRDLYSRGYVLYVLSSADKLDTRLSRCTFQELVRNTSLGTCGNSKGVISYMLCRVCRADVTRL